MEKNIGFFIYDKVQPMDVMGPWEVLSIWKKILKAPINLSLISENGGYVECDDNITLKAHHSFKDAPKLDILIVPGGEGRIKEVDNANVINFIKQQAETSDQIISVCTGMFLLQRAGLLDGVESTTYWRALSELKKFPELIIDEERVVKGGKIWTAGGISSGIDLAFELIAELAGEETAGKVQLLFEYFPTTSTYAKTAFAKMLPPYKGYAGETDEPQLPKYIRDYLEKK